MAVTTQNYSDKLFLIYHHKCFDMLHYLIQGEFQPNQDQTQSVIEQKFKVGPFCRSTPFAQCVKVRKQKWRLTTINIRANPISIYSPTMSFKQSCPWSAEPCWATNYYLLQTNSQRSDTQFWTKSTKFKAIHSELTLNSGQKQPNANQFTAS